MKRYLCLGYERKFSIPYVGSSTDHLELRWLNEIGMLTAKLTEPLSELNNHLELIDVTNLTRFLSSEFRQECNEF